MKNKSREGTNLRHKLKEKTRLGWWRVDGGKEKIKPWVKKEKRKEKSFPAAQPGERRSVSIFPTRRKKRLFHRPQSFREKQRNEGGKKRGRRFEKIIFLSPSHTLSIPLSPSHSLSHTHTYTHTLSLPPLSIPLLMAIKGAENKKKKKTTTTTNFKPAQSMSH